MSKIRGGYPNQASGFPFSEEQIDALLGNAFECALNWTTKDGWPVGVMHVFVWHEGAVWLNFMGHRHRASAIRRDPRVSVIVSSQSAGPDAPQGQATLKGRAPHLLIRCEAMPTNQAKPPMARRLPSP